MFSREKFEGRPLTPEEAIEWLRWHDRISHEVAKNHRNCREHEQMKKEVMTLDFRAGED